ncbi:F-box domain-containing protein [Favolaschia claudopus]|uniref:F-box domain-containing protein n=1 Tax=Favolaschia claudopus TaxID=2862362 RepID=A0AAW0AV82_9AGAR
MLSSLEADRRIILELNAQIEPIELHLAGLRSKRATVQARLDAYKYPVSKIPHEIISEIFLQFLPTYPLCPELAGWYSPTVLTHICSQWRQIALSTPQLWRAINSSGYAVGEIHIINDWLGRCGSCPLSLEIRPAENERKGLLGVLDSQCAHIEHLKIVGSPIVLTLLDSAMPGLRHLHLDLWAGSRSIKLTMAPLLRTAVLVDAACTVVQLPWGQLTALALRFGSPKEFCSILRQAPNLVHCALELKAYYNDEVVRPEVNLPLLRSLVLKSPPQNVDSKMIRSLVAPALRILKVSEQCITTLDQNPLQPLSSFISKSTCKLDELCIIYPYNEKAPYVPLERYQLEFSSIPSISANCGHHFDENIFDE